MLSIATIVLLSVISITQAFTVFDMNRTHDAREEQQEECAHDDGVPDEGKFI